MWFHSINDLRFCNKFNQCFMTDKGCAAVDIPALVITFFGFIGEFAGTAGISGVTAKRASHHDRLSFFIMGLCNDNKPDGFTSSSRSDVKPSALNECVTFAVIHSALSISGLNP